MKIANDNKDVQLKIERNKKIKKILVISIPLLLVAFAIIIIAVHFLGVVKADTDDKSNDSTSSSSQIDSEQNDKVMVKQNIQNVLDSMVKIPGMEDLKADVDTKMSEAEQQQRVIQVINNHNKVVTDTYDQWMDFQVDSTSVKKSIIKQVNIMNDWLGPDHIIGLIDTFTNDKLDFEEFRDMLTSEINQYNGIVKMMQTGTLDGDNYYQYDLVDQAAEVRFCTFTRSVWKPTFLNDDYRVHDILFNWFAQGHFALDHIDNIILEDLKQRVIYDGGYETAYVKATIVNDDGNVYVAYLSPHQEWQLTDGTNFENGYRILDIYQVDSAGNAVKDITDGVASDQSTTGGETS